MALGNNEKTLCNKLLADFDALIAPAYAAKSAIINAKNRMTNRLTGMVQFDLFTGESALNAALEDFRNGVLDNLPGDELDDLQRIKDFIDSCEYLQSLQPISAIIGTALGISDEIQKLISGFDLSIPEFGASDFGSLIDNLLKALPGLPGGDIISDLLAQADKLLECLNGLCALQDPSYYGDLTRMTDDLQGLYDDLNLNDNPLDPDYGTFKYEVVYANAGMHPDHITAINNTKTRLNDSKNAGVTAVENTKSAIQTATKLGELF